MLRKYRANITAVSMHVPENQVDNHAMEKMVDTSDEWIRERTGILKRHFVSKGEANSDLSAKAAQKLLAKRDIPAEDIDLIIVATVTPDMMFPSTACLVQDKIGAKKAWGFDLSGACSGFIYALATGAQFIENGVYSKVVVIGADVMSSIIDFEDRATCVLFGDGAGAVLLEPTEEENVGVVDFILGADGAGGKHLYMPAGGSRQPASHDTVDKKMHYVHQDGRAVYKFAVRLMADAAEQVLQRNGYTASDVSLYVPHQANLRIIDSATERLGLRRDQVAINIDRYANTTAATIPSCLAECSDCGSLQKGDLVVLASFGAGFTWGSVLLKWGF
jgi:3-oxoacyl-[acyl-carrier-protein] synthase III